VSPSRSQFEALQRGLKSDNMAQEPKKVKLVDFSAASAFYGSRKGYVFKTGDQGLGYYLDNVEKAKERVLEGLEGPGLFARAPAVDVEAPETVKAPVPAPAEEPPKKKKRFDPFADLPPPKKKSAPAPKPPTPEPAEKAPVKVFTSGLFKLEQVHCLHIVRKHRDARNPTSWRHPGRRIDRSRQDATDELEKMRTKLLAGLCSVSLVFARRGDGVSRRWRRVDGVYVAIHPSVGSRPRSGLGRKLGRTHGHARAPTRVFRDTTHERAPSTPHATAATHAAPTHRRRSLFQELAKKFSECGSAKKGGDLGMFRRGKMSAAFELAAFNLDVHELSKTVASSSGVHLIYRVA
jgi:hypothetical protein